MVATLSFFHTSAWSYSRPDILVPAFPAPALPTGQWCCSRCPPSGAACRLPCLAWIPLQNARNGCRAPVMRVCWGLCGAVHANAVQILAGAHHAVRTQFLSDLSRPQAADGQLKYPMYHFRRRLVYQPPVLVLRVFLVPIGDVGGKRYPGVAPALHNAANLIARIFRVPFIKEVLHWHDVAHSVGGVDVVHDGDVPHVQPDKIFLQKLAHHKAIPAQPGMVFDHQICHKPLFSQFHDFHESWTGERNCRVSVVKHEPGIWQMIVCGEFLQNSPLILDAAGDAVFLIITGQSGV